MVHFIAFLETPPLSGVGFLFSTTSRIMRFKSLATGLLLIAGGTAAYAELLFADNFDGGTEPLHGTTPGVTLGDATWAAADWLANGTIATSTSTADDRCAFLPFVPLPGNIYTLQVTMTEPTGGASNGWVAIGFTDAAATSAEFWSNDASPWLLWHPSDATNANEAVAIKAPVLKDDRDVINTIGSG